MSELTDFMDMDHTFSPKSTRRQTSKFMSVKLQKKFSFKLCHIENSKTRLQRTICTVPDELPQMGLHWL